MKKTLLVLGCAAAMFAGCSNDETVEVAEKQAIDFTSFVDKSTRAAVDYDNTNLTSVWVYGWRSNSAGDTQLFNETKLTKSGTDWTYSPLKYWEPGYSYTFEAIAPQPGTGTNITFTPNKSASKLGFTNNTETDLIYASASKDLTSETYSTLTRSPGEVELTFKHLLSRVKFTFKNALDASSQAKITVTDVKITNASSIGEIDFNTGLKWQMTNSDLEVSFDPSDADALTNLDPNATGDTEHKYLIPIDGAAYNVTFTVELDQDGVKSTAKRTATIPAMTYEMGKSYNFIAEISLFPIEFTVSVEDWGTFGDQTISVN